MKRIFPASVSAFFLALFIATGTPAASVPSVVGAHDVLAHASSDLIWIAKVESVATPQGSVEQTIILVRQSGPGQQWKTLAIVPARVTELASRGLELVVLMNGGRWQFVWGLEGASTGQPLPAGGIIRAIGDDVENLWAIGSVKGGLAAATAPPATQPTTSPSDPTAATVAQSSTPSRLVLFRQRDGLWEGLADLPLDIAESSLASAADMSLTVAGGRPYVAVELNDGSIRTIRLQADDHTWEDVGTISSSGEGLANLKLLNSGNIPTLWVSRGNETGRLYPGAGIGERIDLKWVGDNAPDSPPAITVSGGYQRLIGLHGGRLFEQRYDLKGAPVDSASALAVPVNVSSSMVDYWFRIGLYAALTISMIATIYRRVAWNRAGVRLNPPPPAPLLPRALAGLIDLLPVVIGVVVVSLRMDSSQEPWDRLEDIPALITLGATAGCYLLHTTLVELLTGRTAGKWVCGLTVVSLDGAKPTTGQILVRNLLRVLDLAIFPLVMVVISPMRQRSADVAAGTIVVRLEDAKKAVEEAASNTRIDNSPHDGPTTGSSGGNDAA